MKAIIFHGSDATPNDQWLPWLKNELEKKGYIAETPHYPNLNHAPIKDFITEIIDKLSLDLDTILIGHSAGAPLILSILENTNKRIKKAILVAGFSEPLSKKKDPVLQDSYNWDKIRSHSDEFVFVNSDDDPWGCNDKQGRRMFDKLGGTLVIRHEGHFGSDTFNQTYKEFPLLLSLVTGETK